MADDEAAPSSSGIDAWFMHRRRSWASRNRGLLLAAWFILALCVVASLIPLATEFLLPRGGVANSAVFMGARSAVENLCGFSLLILHFQMCGSCISYCLPGADFTGGLGNREFHLALRRNCLAIAYRLALQLLLPAMLAGALADLLISISLLPGMLPAELTQLVLAVLLPILCAVLAAQLGLRLPGMAAAMRTGLGLLGVLLALGLASAPLFITYITTDSFSTLNTGQVRLMVTTVPPAILLLTIIGLLAWSRVLPPDLIEELERHSVARKV